MTKYAKLFLIVGLFLIVFSPWLFTRDAFFISFGQKSGYIGDTIGGITSPIINFLGAILVYLSFSEQIKANQILRNDSVINNFNSRYVEIKDEFNKLSFPISEMHTDVTHRKFDSAFDSYVSDLEKRGEGNILFEYHLKYVFYLFKYFIDELNDSNLDFEIKKSLFLRLYQFYYANLSFQLDLMIDFSNMHEYDVPITRLASEFFEKIEYHRKYFNIPDSGEFN